MTRGSDLKPVKRMMSSMFGDEYVVELRARVIVIRPKGTRRMGPCEVGIPVGSIYQRALVAKLDAEKRDRRKSRKR